MELHLQPLAPACFVSGTPFADGDAVASYLVQNTGSAEIVRCDVLASAADAFVPAGRVVCSWRQLFKPRPAGENSARLLRLTAENLFLTLADPAAEPAPDSQRLVQFLALLLERKRILRARGSSADGARNVFEHIRTKQLFEVPAGELSPEFFLSLQSQLGLLVGAK